MRLVPVIVSMILASAMLGYGFAQAQSATAPGGTPTTASHPYATICGDHPCKPGETYTPGATSSNATTSTNSSAASASTQVNISANATATKKTGSTNTNSSGNSLSTSVGMSEKVTVTKITNNTKAQTNMTSTSNMTSTVQKAAPVESPAKQVASGTAPSDVKCPTGYQLALNKFDQRPACVTADVYAKLVARGWTS